MESANASSVDCEKSLVLLQFFFDHKIQAQKKVVDDSNVEVLDHCRKILDPLLSAFGWWRVTDLKEAGKECCAEVNDAKDLKRENADHDPKLCSIVTQEDRLPTSFPNISV